MARIRIQYRRKAKKIRIRGDKRKNTKHNKNIKQQAVAKKHSKSTIPKYEDLYRGHATTAKTAKTNRTNLASPSLAEDLAEQKAEKGQEKGKVMKTLPQTGENEHQNGFLAAFGLAMSSLAALFGIADKKKKKDE